MDLFFILFLVIILAIGGYHLTFRRLRLPIGPRRFFLTGIEFLLLGILIGPQFLNILDARTADDLAPLTILILGWIGLLFGVQFEIPKLRRIPRQLILSAGIESFVTALVTGLGMLLFLPYFIPIPGGHIAPILLILSATAAATAQTGLALQAGSNRVSNRKTITVLRYLASVNGLTAMIALGLAFLVRNTLPERQLFLPEKIYTFLFPLLAVLVFLLVYLLFLSHRKQESELALIVIGMTIFTSGAAMLLNFSPLFANFLLGAALVNLTRDKERIFRLLVSVEKPIYLLLLVFLGGKLQYPGRWIFIAALLYFILRTGGKLTGGYLAAVIQKKEDRLTSFLGLGLLEQGGLPLAILFDFYKGFPEDFTGHVVSLVMIAIIGNDLLSPFLLTRLFQREKS